MLIGELTTGDLRVLFRGLQIFESFYESDGITVVCDPQGRDWTIWDLRTLYAARTRLSARQCQAIEMCLYENVKETDAALLMGIEPQSPVCIYANNGLRRIVAMFDNGELRRFRPDDYVEPEPEEVEPEPEMASAA